MLSPLTIVEGTVLDFYKHFHISFGEYVHTYEGTTNIMKLCTIGTLTLGPSGNLQGGVCCYSLEIRKIFHPFLKYITILKMSQGVLCCPQWIVCWEKSVKGLVFGDCNTDNCESFKIGTGVNDAGFATNANANANTDTHVNHPSELVVERNNDDTAPDGDADADVAGVPNGTNGGAGKTNVARMPGDANGGAEAPDNTNVVHPEHQDNKVQPPQSDSNSDSDDDNDNNDKNIGTTCYGRVSKPFNI